MSDDLIKLYSQRLLALAADIPHLGKLEGARSATARSPHCGSTVTVHLRGAERIEAFAQEVRACALGQASAGVAGAVLPGLTRAEVQRGRDAVAAMLRGGPVPEAPFAGYEALLPARDFPNRHASILLVLDATLAAFDA